ncbi:MAG: hypothetical protein QOI40_572, partial [Alphaproteobacteria bacterium]|nr:hypothetical protein [Alphaproteobacteria bacterium]
MKSAWVDSEARAAIDRYGAQGVDLALRVYTSRLLGRDPKLVLHGGGNTSVKTTLPDLLGEEVAVLCIKGSGSDLATIEPQGLPAVRLERLRRLRARAALTDEDMVRVQRENLLDPMAPNPSVETLLHAFLPHKFVDHTHANAILSLVDQPDGEAICADVYDGRMSVVPYVMPGFALAQTAANIYDAGPTVEGLILHKHGIFTFGDSAREAYERMIALVTLAEERLRKNRKAVFVTAQLPQAIAPLAAVAPILRGACSLQDPKIEGAWRRLILDFRTGPAILNFVNGADVARYSQAGLITPDHTIRTKNWPLIVAAPEHGKPDEFKRAARNAVKAFIASYEAYFARQNARVGGTRRALDPLPRVALVPGLGLFGLGRSKKDAKVAADLAECAVETITDAEAIGRFESISEAEMFDMEYWSLEQAKLGAAKELPLAGQIAAITGAGGTIGAATAKAFAAAGAEVALLDLDESAARERAKAIGGNALALPCDVTDPASVTRAFDQVADTFGGVDIVVSNAGAAWQGRIGEVDEEVLRKSFELNFYGHQRVAQAAVRIMLAQGTGGCLLFNVSKQAVNPGPNFGPYGLPKAATL